MVRDLLLDCCDIELDRRGNVIDYTRRSGRRCGCGCEAERAESVQSADAS
jgi:hypothetical protein